MSLRRNAASADRAPGHRRGPVGQALVEFALVIPVFMLVVVALFDLGRGVYAYNTIANAARDAARVASVNQIFNSPDCNPNHPVESPSDPHWSIAACAAQAAVSLGVTQSDVSVSYSAPEDSGLTCTEGDLAVGCLVTVTVKYTYTPITPFIGNFIGQIHLQSTSQVQVERVFP